MIDLNELLGEINVGKFQNELLYMAMHLAMIIFNFYSKNNWNADYPA